VGPVNAVLAPTGYYDTGVVSGALDTTGSDLSPAVLSSGQKFSFETSPCSNSKAQIETLRSLTFSLMELPPYKLITPATTFGALLGVLGAGTLSNYAGGRLMLGIAHIIFMGAAAGQALSHDVWPTVRPEPPTSTRTPSSTLMSSIDWE